ncbi:MAG: tetratricopeptide repeat protein [Bacteroidia bacterium]
MRFLKLAFLIILCAFSGKMDAQTDASHFRKGNELYEDGKFNEAEIEYRKGLEKNGKSWTGKYNLANALYKQEKFTEASAILDSLKENTSNEKQKSRVYHNLGNSLLKEKEYEKSIDSYKEALKLNPEAEDSRYNLSYAYKMLKKQQEQQQQQEKKQKEQDKDPEKKKQQNQEQQEEQKQNINRQEAERMLDALDRKEKEIRKDQQKKEKQEGVGGTGKDW